MASFSGLRPFVRAFYFACSLGVSAAFLLATADPAEAARRRHRAIYAPPYAALVIDAKTGRVLHAVNPDAPRHPASITKVMTLYLLFEEIEAGRLSLETRLRMSANAARQAPSKLGVEAGETIRVEDAIKALVTKSANDVAVMVAESIAGSEEAFAQRMTRKARALGMSRTIFHNASGLPNTEQLTTARDLARLGIALQQRFPQHYRYFALRGFEFEGAYFRNHNKLLGRIESVDGIKTGYTRLSGFNLLTSAKADGRHIIAVVLGGRTGRARDGIMAGLVDAHLPRAHAGRPTAAVKVAQAPGNQSEDDDEHEAPRKPAAQRPLPPSPPMPTPRPTFLTATGAAIGAVTGSRPVTAQPRTIKPAVAIATASPTTPVALARPLPPVGVMGKPPTAPPAAVVPARPQQPVPAPRVAMPRDDARGKGNQRLSPPAQLGNGAPPLAYSRPGDPRPPRPPLDLSPTGTIKLAAPRAPDAEDDEKPAAPEAKIAAPKEVKPAVPASPNASLAGTWVIQLGAMDDRSKALDVLEMARARNGATLAKAKPVTEPVEKGGATLWRARFTGFDSQAAHDACRALKRNGFACFATKA